MGHPLSGMRGNLKAPGVGKRPGLVDGSAMTDMDDHLTLPMSIPSAPDAA